RAGFRWSATRSTMSYARSRNRSFRTTHRRHPIVFRLPPPRSRLQMRIGRIPYINCYPVYGAIDRGIVPIGAELVDGVPTALNQEMAAGTIDVSVISAVEYARDATKY